MSILENELYLNDIQVALSRYDFSELNNKTILVTGAKGLICSCIVDILLFLKRTGIEINVIAAGRNCAAIDQRFEHKVKSVEYDATHHLGFSESFDFIIHGAGIASPELYTSNPVETLLSHFCGVNSVLKYCINKSVKMVYISSSEVYGLKATEDPYSEKDYGFIDQDNIRNSYSEAKRASEILCRSYAKEYGVHVSIVRPGHVFGPTASEQDRRIVSDFSYKAARRQNLRMLSAGLQKRSYCYCIDAACAILVALVHGVSGEAYNIGTEDVITIRDMAEILANAGGVQLFINEPTEYEKNAFNPMNNSSLSFEKLKRIGYMQSISTSIGLCHTVKILMDYYNNNNE